MTSYLPWGFLVLGGGLLALSLWLEARSRRPGEAETAGRKEPEPAPAPA